MKRFHKIKLLVLVLSVIGTALFSFSYRIPATSALLGMGDIVHDPIGWIQAKLENALHSMTKNQGKILRRILAGEIRKMLIKQGTFVTNWRNYSRRSQDTGTIIARQLLGESARGIGDDPETAVMCAFFRDSIANTYKAKRVTDDFAAISRAFRIDSQSTFKLLTRCTLPRTLIVNGVEKEFNPIEFWDTFEGGWPVYERMFDQENNYFSVNQTVRKEFEKQRQAQEQAALNDAIAGNGFISITNPNGQIKTPGKILQDTTSNFLDKELACFENADSWILIGTCAKNILVKQLTNFRNITDKLDLLDDSVGDQEDGGAGEPEPPPTPGLQECEQFCTDTVTPTCQQLVPAPASSSSPFEQEQYKKDFGDCMKEQVDSCLKQVEYCGAPAPTP